MLEIQKALQSSDRLIAVLSPDYLAAGFPQPEWAAMFAEDAKGETKRLVPVMVRQCEPEGPLGPIVQIRIQGLESADATQKLLAGVSAYRARPTTPPMFPGPVCLIPGATGNEPTAPAERLIWRRLPFPPEVHWRNELDNRLPNQGGHESVELHLVPDGDDARSQVSELTDLKTALPEHVRRHGVFSATGALEVLVDGTKNWFLVAG
ncbi:TIR domain-containing protein [Glycomyces harbinensis]|uniref:TIR domain-containing protein n=2 Tax=Glycomyces harbinensis TaxID=58114 RepID=A0A1G6XN71_9ACTN|nr:TIR domain-containing protein [Glycomyces harbinensis]